MLALSTLPALCSMLLTVEDPVETLSKVEGSVVEGLTSYLPSLPCPLSFALSARSACPVEFLSRLPYGMMLQFDSIGVKSRRAISLGHATGGTIQLG